MELTIFCNYLNHHQVWVADEIYKILGPQFSFVVTLPSDPAFMKGGGDYSQNRDYCISACEVNGYKKAVELAIHSEICIFGGDSLEFAVIRAKQNPTGVSFEQGERWLKRGYLNLLSPRLIKWRWCYHKYLKKANFYYLCASSFGAMDLSLMHTYKNRCFKWGYFTKASNFSIDEIVKQKDNEGIVSMMWCARFIDWKHPEMPVLLAKNLKELGYKFKIDMYGAGPEFEKVSNLAENLHVTDCVSFKGVAPNNEILDAMKCHLIFLFTSDKNEGWGAVANESMSCGCILVGSDEIGSVPYLLEGEKAGLVFRSRELESLTNKVKWLLDNRFVYPEYQMQALETINNIWSPYNAAHNLLVLIDDIKNNRNISIKTGPCSFV